MACKSSKINFAIIPIALTFLSLGFSIQPHIPLAILSLASITTAFYSTEESKRRSDASSKTLFALILLFLLSTAISYSVSVNVERSTLLCLSFFPGLLIAFLINETFGLNDIRWIFIVLTIFGIILSIRVLHIPLREDVSDPALWMKKLKSPYFLTPNDLILLSIIVPFSLSLILLKTHFSIKVLSFLNILLSFIAISVYHSRGAFLIAFVAVLLMALKKRFLLIVSSSLIIVSILAVGIFTKFSFLAKFAGSWSQRVLFWIVAWDMFLDKPVFGHGPRTYGALYETYLTHVSVPEWITVDPRYVPWAHNLYLEILAEQGIVGFTSFFLVIAGLLSVAGKSRVSDNDLKTVRFAIMISLLCFFLAGAFELSFVRYWVVIIFFYMIGIIGSLSKIEIRKGRVK